MIWSLIPERRDDPELMDAPGLPEAEVAEAYRVLGSVNRQLGNLRSMGLEIRRFLAEDRIDSGRVSLLDVGAGSGDIADALRRRLATRRVEIRAVALDRDHTAIRLADHRGLSAVRGDALRLPFGDRCIDLVTAVKFAHHFGGDALTRLASEMARVARRRVIVLDIRRHWLAYWGFVAWSRLFTSNRLVRFDGPLSVLRGFTQDEMMALGTPLREFTWTVHGRAGFQLALVGRRLEPGPGLKPDLP